MIQVNGLLFDSAGNLQTSGGAGSPSMYVRWEDFSCVQQNTSVTSSTSVFADNKWSMSQISSGTGVFEQQNETDGIHYGVLKFGNSGATSGYGAVLFMGGGGLSATVLNPTSQAFNYRIAFQMVQNVTSALYIGFIIGNNQTTVPSGATSIFTGLRFDTSLSDTNFSFVTGAGTSQTVIASSEAADTNWHIFQMWGNGTGPVNMSLDNGAVNTFSTNIDNAFLDIGIQSVTRTTAANYVLIDYTSLVMSGLSR